MAYKIQKQYRYKGYDYSQEGFYFVTFCTKDREMFFGDVIGKYHEKFIEDAEIKLSEIGQAAERFWLEIPNHFSFVELDEYEIMPNHVHGIIQITNKQVGTGHCPVLVDRTGQNPTGIGQCPVPTDGKILTGTGQCPVRTDIAGLGGGSKFGQVTAGSISTIIGSYKSVVTKFCMKNNLEFGWQTRFYDRIIRNEKELNRIRQYIRDNAMKWVIDRNNTEGLFM